MSTLNDLRNALRGTTPALLPYILKTANFTAEAGKAYAADTSGMTEVAEVMPSITFGGVVFTSKTRPAPDEGLYISAYNDPPETQATEFGVNTVFDVSTCGDVVAAVNASLDATFTAALAEGALSGDIFPNEDSNFTYSGGSDATTVPTPFNVTLPASPSAGDVIALADAKGTWGSNAVVVLRNGNKIEATTTDFTNNAAGTFFSLLYIDSTTGWRVLASGTKPLNLVAPTLTGTYSFTASTGTWTGSPASYAYQWEISDDGETGWSDIEGATSASYLAIEAQEGKYVRCGVIATNANGPSTEAFTASSIAIVIPDFPLTDLLAFWKMSDLTDASGNGNTLTDNNGMTFDAGKIGNAAVLGGTGDNKYFSFDASLLNGLSAWTLSMWVKRNPLLCNGNLAFSGNTYTCILLTVTGSEVVLQTGAGGASGAFSHDDEWAHIVAQQDGSSGRVYVNGVLEGTGSFSGGLAGASYYHFPSQHSNQRFGGMMDAVGLWSRALTEPEIALLYSGGAGVEPA